MRTTTLHELQSAPLTLQMPVTALAYRRRLNPHAVIPLVSIFMLVSLSRQCFTLLETWDYNFQRKEKTISHLNVINSLKRHILQDIEGQTSKNVLIVFHLQICFALLFV